MINIDEKYQQKGIYSAINQNNLSPVDWCYFGIFVSFEIVPVCCSQGGVKFMFHWQTSLSKQQGE